MKHPPGSHVRGKQARGDGGHEAANSPIFTKGKYNVPVDREFVTKKWGEQGYANPSVALRAAGWSRGKHSHEWDLLIAPLSGQFALTISGQHFSVEPGDELFYPAQAEISSRNAFNGDSQMLISFRELSP